MCHLTIPFFGMWCILMRLTSSAVGREWLSEGRYAFGQSCASERKQTVQFAIGSCWHYPGLLGESVRMVVPEGGEHGGIKAPWAIGCAHSTGGSSISMSQGQGCPSLPPKRPNDGPLRRAVFI